MCARRFLLILFALTLLAVAGGFAVFQFGGEVLKGQTVPKGEFEAPPPQSGPDYAQAENWLNLPTLAASAQPAEWRPRDYPPTPVTPPRASVFYIHPTTYLQRDRWNALLADPESQKRAALFVRSQASAFNGVGAVYAPKYRQAAFGAFLDDSANATAALDLAYSDVARGFDRFLAQADPELPIILAGHSQGALHLTRLLRDKVAGRPVASRIAAAYVVGWPVSVATDVPRMGLAPCERPDQARCILSWQSFGEPANTNLIADVYDGTEGFTGQPRRREDMLCVNPLTGTRDAAALAASNLGTLVPIDLQLTDATLQAGAVGARCENGFLLIAGDLPDIGPYVLPGNNYHVYDYALFWGSIRQDAKRRVAAWR
jgi:hypothetical protein